MMKNKNLINLILAGSFFLPNIGSAVDNLYLHYPQEEFLDNLGYTLGVDVSCVSQSVFKSSFDDYSWKFKVHPNGDLTSVCIDYDGVQGKSNGCYNKGQGFSLYSGQKDARCMLQTFAEENIRPVIYGLNNGIFVEYDCDVDDQRNLDPTHKNHVNSLFPQ